MFFRHFTKRLQSTASRQTRQAPARGRRKPWIESLESRQMFNAGYFALSDALSLDSESPPAAVSLGEMVPTDQFSLNFAREASSSHGDVVPTDQFSLNISRIGAAAQDVSDAIWMDLGFPVSTATGADTSKPLFAWLVIDLDNRAHDQDDDVWTAPTTDPASAGEQLPQYWVFGTELPSVVLNEVIAEHQEPTAPNSSSAGPTWAVFILPYIEQNNLFKPNSLTSPSAADDLPMEEFALNFTSGDADDRPMEEIAMTVSPLHFTMMDGSVRGVSWAVLILPYIEQDNLHEPSSTAALSAADSLPMEEFALNFTSGDADDRPTEEAAMNSSPLQFAMGDGSVRGVSWSVSIPPYIERVELMIVDAPVAGPTWVSLILPDIEEFLRYRLQYPTETEQIVSIPPYNYEEFFLRGDADDRPTEEVALNFTRVEFMFVDAPVAGPTWVTLILPDME